MYAARCLNDCEFRVYLPSNPGSREADSRPIYLARPTATFRPAKCPTRGSLFFSVDFSPPAPASRLILNFSLKSPVSPEMAANVRVTIHTEAPRAHVSGITSPAVWNFPITGLATAIFCVWRAAAGRVRGKGVVGRCVWCVGVDARSRLQHIPSVHALWRLEPIPCVPSISFLPQPVPFFSWHSLDDAHHPTPA